MNQNTSAIDTLLPSNWFWQKVIPDNVLDCLNLEIEKIIDTKKQALYGIPEVTKQDLSVRNSEVLALDPLNWFSGIIFNFAIASNTFSGWNFNINSPEPLQIAFYGPEQHYTWHSDSVLMSKNNLIRKITAVCMLSDTSEYEGGKLELEDVGEVHLNRGDIIVFPSFYKHRVIPVTSGLRKTATLWISGNRTW